MRTLLSTILLNVFILASGPPAFTADGWETNITVTARTAEVRLSLGQRADATDGRDGLYDVPPMAGGEVSASFVHDDGTLWRDIRSTSTGIKTWTLRVVSSHTDEDVALTWTPQSLPADATAALVDSETGTRTDMRKNSRYTYKNTGVRDLSIELTR